MQNILSIITLKLKRAQFQKQLKFTQFYERVMRVGGVGGWWLAEGGGTSQERLYDYK